MKTSESSGTDGFGPQLDRLLPQALDSEQVILGALLTAGAMGVAEALETLAAAEEYLSAGDFGKTEHRHIFAAVQDICGQGETPDLATVIEQLETAGTLLGCGGPAYLRACLEAAAARAPAYVQQHARRVWEASAKTRIIELSGHVMGSAYNGRSVEELAEEVGGLTAVLRPRGRYQPEILSGPEVMAMDLPPARWAVEGLVPEGLTLMIGGSKLGKSFLCYQLALGIADGGMALGKIRVEQGGVLYLALEDTWRRIQSRIGMFYENATVPPSIHIAREWRSPPQGLADLEAFIGKHPETRLVIVDTFAAMRGVPTSKANIYYLETNEIRQFKAIADRCGVSIVIVHHTNKTNPEDWMDASSGSTGLVGGADGAILLVRRRGQEEATLKRTGRDLDDESDVKIAWQEHAGWVYLGNADEWNLSQTQRRILAAFAADLWQPATAAGLAERLGQTPATTRKQLYRMSVAGICHCTTFGGQSIWSVTVRARENAEKMETIGQTMSHPSEAS